MKTESTFLEHYRQTEEVHGRRNKLIETETDLGPERFGLKTNKNVEPLFFPRVPV